MASNENVLNILVFVQTFSKKLSDINQPKIHISGGGQALADARFFIKCSLREAAKKIGYFLNELATKSFNPFPLEVVAPWLFSIFFCGLKWQEMILKKKIAIEKRELHMYSKTTIQSVS